jgi:hypothetical protein
MAALATSGYWAGVVIVPAVGQTILTTAGLLSGRITSIVSVSAALMAPEDRMVDWVIGTRFLDKWVSGPSGAAIFWRATSRYIGLVDLGQAITSDRFHDQLQGRLQAVKCWLLGRRSAIKHRTDPGPVISHPSGT